MNSSEIRARFLAFFEKRGHTKIPSASLVTSDEKGVTNPTLFNTAGMQPLIPYLLGKPYIHTAGQELTRLVDVQKCLRTVDIDDIGDQTHATFFEMLGNWSLGDYFKKEAIEWSYEFLTSKSEGLGLDPTRLYVTVFEGDDVAPRDDEAAAIWKDIFGRNGIAGAGGDTTKGESGRIFYLPAANNWWQAGEDGPCGPDSEMFYDMGNTFAGRAITKDEYIKADESRQVVEVWNDVFMQYVKKAGKIVGKLPKPSVDTGAGLERVSMAVQGVDTIYATSLLAKTFALTENLAGSVEKRRIITDHVRASSFLISDGVTPSNTGRGYILRRLIRKAVFSTSNRKLSNADLQKLIESYVETYREQYPELAKNADHIVKVIGDEADKFSEALALGVHEFEKIAKLGKDITGEQAFNLFASFGLPIDLTRSLAAQHNLTVDLAGFELEFKKHQDLSRAGAEQKFKGGLADANDPMVVRYHTATHLLHQALHDVLGEGVGQKGSNITPERLRFDFSYGAKMTDEQKKQVEAIVNEKISAALPMNKVVMPLAEAEKTGARHFFGEKYGTEVSIYYIGDDLIHAYSKEFCGGPHVTNTNELAGPEGTWKFKIAKEEAVAQGIRRIKAVLA